MANYYATPRREGNVLVKGVELPVVYFEAWEQLEPEIESFKPDYIISFGLAPLARGVRFERAARNEDEGYRDNNRQRHEGSIILGGPDLLYSDLPIDDLIERMESSSITASASTDAGGYLCNHVFYFVMYYCMQHPEIRGGFVYMPSWPVEGNGEETQMSVLKIILNEIEEETLER